VKPTSSPWLVARVSRWRINGGPHAQSDFLKMKSEGDRPLRPRLQPSRAIKRLTEGRLFEALARDHDMSRTATE